MLDESNGDRTDWKLYKNANIYAIASNLEWLTSSIGIIEDTEAQ